MAEIRTALKSGSSKELAKYFPDKVELNLEGKKSHYNRAQAEGLVKDFFATNPATDFTYIHQGASKEGLKYAIGKFICTGKSYRVYMLLKNQDGRYTINTLDFSRE
ncbi:MAG: DUF4783 domain-containing protein [Cytophagales bacterium]|nr:DUF4783 domain-containing protein [Cytophagales bacterium]